MEITLVNCSKDLDQTLEAKGSAQGSFNGKSLDCGKALDGVLSSNGYGEIIFRGLDGPLAAIFTPKIGDAGKTVIGKRNGEELIEVATVDYDAMVTVNFLETDIAII